MTANNDELRECRYFVAEPFANNGYGNFEVVDSVTDGRIALCASQTNADMVANALNIRANEAKGGEAVAPTVDDIEVGIAPIARIDFSPTIPRIVWFKKVSQKIGELDVYTRHVSLSEDARDAERLRFIAKEQCTLRIVDIPIPLSSDAETVWEVVDYYLAEPKERIIGTGSTPQEAIDAAMAHVRRWATESQNIPIYTSPRATAEDVRDAERYRKLRTQRVNPYAVLPVGEKLDAYLDAMAEGREVGNG